MPGCDYYGKAAGFQEPTIMPFPLAKSLTGTGTPPAAALRQGDLVVYTINTSLVPATLTPCVRMLLAADKTAHYKEGTPVAGILGMIMDDATTDSSANAIAPANPGGPGGFAYQFSNPALWHTDPSGLAVQRVLIMTPGIRFTMRLDINATDFTGAITVKDQFNNQLAGILLSAASGVTTYKMQAGTTMPVNGGTGAAALDSCLVCLGPDTSDPLFNVPITASGAAGSGALGPRMIFEVLGSFAQFNTSVPYSTQ